MHVVAAIPAVGLIAGAVVGLLLPDSPQLLWSLALAGGAAASLWAWRWGRAPLFSLGVGAGFAAGGALLAATAWQHAWRPTLRVVFDELARAQRIETRRSGRSPSEDVTVMASIEGVLRADASPTDAGASLSVQVDRIDTPCRRDVDGGVLLTVVGGGARDRIDEWRAGRRVRAPVHLRRPSRYLDPGVPDAERALARRGVTLVGTVKSSALVTVASRAPPWTEAAGAVRLFARRWINRSVGHWGTRAAAIVTAIVIGDRAGLDADLQQRLQDAGTYHVIAISGGNIAVLAGLTLGVFRVAGLLGRGAMLMAIAGLVAYAQVVGGSASVDRATLMAVVYFGGRAMDLKGSALNALASVAAFLVAVDPLAVADPAFVLTSGATLGILAMAGTPRGGLSGRRETTWHLAIALIASMLIASLAAEAALLPVGAAFFSRVTLAGLALNLAAIPLMTVAQIAGMALVPLAAVSPQAALALGWVAWLAAEGLVRSSDLVTVVPILAWRVAPPHWLAISTYYFALVGVLVARRPLVTSRRTPQLLLRVSAAIFAGATIWIVAEPWRLLTAGGDGRLHVTFIDVGQGDAAMVRFPQGSSVVVDTGGLRTPAIAVEPIEASSDSTGSAGFDIGDRVVAPVLRHAGIHRLDALALTHGDADHIGGAASVVGEFRPIDVWEGIPVPSFEPLMHLQRSVAAVGSRWTNVQSHDRTTVDGVTIVVRHPNPADWERQRVRNDDSIVLELLWGDVSIVLTGDIGREVEEKIAGDFAPVPLRIVKVPHHGSLTSSSIGFVRALAPSVAVVSVGRSNTFGHPAPEVLARYRDIGANIFRTDQDGAVTITTDGRSLEVHTFTGRTLTTNHESTSRARD